MNISSIQPQEIRPETLWMEQIVDNCCKNLVTNFILYLDLGETSIYFCLQKGY